MPRGSRSLQSSATVAARRSPEGRCKKKKSPLFSRSSGVSPRLMLCALRMMRLSPLWRKISVRRTAATACERSTSRKKLPGPTLGSWSASPTSTRRHPFGSAFNSA